MMTNDGFLLVVGITVTLSQNSKITFRYKEKYNTILHEVLRFLRPTRSDILMI